MRSNDEYMVEKNRDIWNRRWRGKKWGKQKRRRHEERRRQGEWEELCALKRKMMDRERERLGGRVREGTVAGG